MTMCGIVVCVGVHMCASLFFFFFGVQLTFDCLICNCSYQNPEGQLMLRVTTISRTWIDSAVSSEVCKFRFHIFFIFYATYVICLILFKT